VIEHKNQLHWNQKGLTNFGWTNLYAAAKKTRQLHYSKKQLQNKFNDMKRSYQTWLKLQTHTCLGHDPTTGDVAVDPTFFEDDNEVVTHT
jgi:hypothetical protein